jgi:hypothetical protein
MLSHNERFRILEGSLTPLEGLEGIMNVPFHMESFDEKA